MNEPKAKAEVSFIWLDLLLRFLSKKKWRGTIRQYYWK